MEHLTLSPIAPLTPKKNMVQRNWKSIAGFNFEDILFEEFNHIAKITINRPRYRNAFTPRTVWEMSQAIVVKHWISVWLF